ncbi:MAG: DUF1883 domain-containing protein [Gemmataceae bacterium]
MTPMQTRSPSKPFLHQEMAVGPDDLIEITLNNPANILLLDPENYEHYRNNRPFLYAKGGYVKHSPFRLYAPSFGNWHLAIDLGGGPGHVRAWVRVFSEPTPPKEATNGQEKE